MLKNNELRIGNLVKWYDVSKVLELHSEKNKFDNVCIECEESFEWNEYNKLEPIPLTEEWLLIFGFKKRKNRHLFYWENKIVISEYKDEFENFFYPKTGYDIRFSNEIKYVHQLQNLYFALTGAELTVA